MKDFILWYISVGNAFYLVFAIKDATNKFELYRNSDLIGILRGLLIIPLWPYLLWTLEVEK